MKTDCDDFYNSFVKPKPGQALVVGSKIYPGRTDQRKKFEQCIGLDMLEGDGVDLVWDLENPLPKQYYNFSHVECCSVLEHARRPWLVAKNIENSLRNGGTLFVSVPFVWRIHAYPNDYFRFTPEGLKSLFEKITFSEIRMIVKGKMFNYLDAPSFTIDDDGKEAVTFERCLVMGFGKKCGS